MAWVGSLPLTARLPVYVYMIKPNPCIMYQSRPVCVADMVIGAVWSSAHGGAGTKVMQTLRVAVRRRKVKWTDNTGSATHTIVILTDGAVASGSASAGAIVRLLKGGKRFIFVMDGFDFCGEERKGADPLIDAALDENEAMAYRAPEPPQMLYEHDAMVDEMLARLNKVGGARISLGICTAD